ncbi:MAG: hypothetical protein ACU836_15830, partial [Gammaproteobacteria bacterium]
MTTQVISVIKQGPSGPAGVVLIPGSPNGYIDRSQVSLSWDDSTRTITISPVSDDFSFYSNGVLFTKTGPISYQISDVDGNHFVRFDEFGIVGDVSTFEPNLIHKWCWIAAIYWNST